MSRATTSQRLLSLLLAATGAVWLALGVLGYASVRAELRQVMDGHLRDVASLLMLTTHHEVHEDDVAGYQAHLGGAGEGNNVVFQVWSADGELIFFSPGVGTEPLSSARAGFHDTDIRDERWRVLVHRRAESPYRVIVAAPLAERGRMLDHFAFRSLMPLAWLFLPLTVLIWLGVRQGLAPISRISAQLRSHLPDSLEPLAVEGLPRDLLPMVDALNSLLGRLRAAHQRHERVASEVAHELRTPLAGARALVQAARDLTDSPGCREGLDEALEGVDQATHRVEQVLTLARLEPEHGGTARFEDIDLKRLVSAELAERVPAALAREVGLELEAPDPVSVRGDPGLLRLMVGNLVENAVRHSPGGAPVTVSVAREGDQVVIRVRDRGPGIPAAERRRVFESFYRSGRPSRGAGLGLAIVRRIAEVHGGDAGFEDPAAGPGIVARVTLRPPDG